MPIERYGLQFADGATDATIELVAFRMGWPTERGGLGRFGHLRNAIDLLWNEPRRRYAAQRGIDYDPSQQDAYIWNDWTEWMVQTFCENEWTTVTGPASSWKTTSAGIYANGFWCASPADTVVIEVSTTLDGLRRRIWKETTKYHRGVGIGNLVQSRNCIQFTKGSDDAGIFGIAVDKGEVDKAIGKIIGFHARRILVIVDEMQTVSEAIVEACVNLESGCEEFQFIGLGNASSRFDPHGRMCEPMDGWNAITENSPEWRTRRGVCIHLDGLDSPNVKAGVDKYPGLLKQRDIDNTIDRYGENSPQFWQMRRGFWAPEGITKTVLSETMILKFKAKEKAVWVGETRKGAGVDPAFEGNDRCILRIGRCGAVNEGGLAMTPGKPIPIKVDITSKEPLHYQLARKIHEHCAAEEIAKNMLAIDSTGEGDGIASILIREYGYNLLRVEFGGRPSNDAVSNVNPKRADQEYLNRVTEIWYRFRAILQAGQIRELDDATAAEFCARRYEMRGSLIQAETKTEMKARANRSPDLADAACVLAMLFHKQGLLGATTSGILDSQMADWNKIARERDVSNHEQSYLVAAI